MLLRTTAIALLAANALYLGWSQGWLAPVGLAPDTASEPQRLAQQIRPEALRVAQTASAANGAALPASAAVAASGPAPMASGSPEPRPAAGPASPPVSSAAPANAQACLQAGPYDAAQADALRQALAAAGLPESAWALEGTGLPNRWIVYMGRYTDPETLDRKRAELRALRVETAPIGQPALAPGLSLGVFSTAAAAQEHLAQLARRGVRTARVVPEHPENAAFRLRLPAADEGLRARVQKMAGKPFIPC